MTKADVATMIGIIKARYPRATWGPDDALTVEAWHLSLGDLPVGPVQQAIRAHFEHSEFAPDPAEIRRWLIAESGIAPEPADAWRLVCAARKGYYPGLPYTGPVLPDAVSAALKSIGGLHAISTSDTPTEDRDAFLRAYATYRKRALETPGLGLEALPNPERTAHVGELAGGLRAIS